MGLNYTFTNFDDFNIFIKALMAWLTITICGELGIVGVI